jgi:hypothetical protein
MPRSKAAQSKQELKKVARCSDGGNKVGEGVSTKE